MGIGAKIKEYRTKAGLTQKDLADKLYVTYQAVSRWENDEAEPSFDTLKEICKILNCSTDDLFEIEKKVEPNEEKQEEVKVVEKVIVQEQKVVLGICEKCSKPLFNTNEFKKFEETHVVHHGRSSHVEKKQVILCNECYEKRLQDIKNEEERKERLRLEGLRKKIIHFFIWPSILAVIFIIIGITKLSSGDTSTGFVWLGVGVLSYAFLATMILNNTFITDLWMEVASWGFVKMPGIIFSFSFGGLVFLIAMKIFLFLLGIALALAAAALATAIAMALSIFVYPFALRRNIKKIA